MKIIELKSKDVVDEDCFSVNLSNSKAFMVDKQLAGKRAGEMFGRYYRIITGTEPVREESENIILYTAPGVCISIEKCVGCHDAAAFIGAIAVMLDNSVGCERILG